MLLAASLCLRPLRNSSRRLRAMSSSAQPPSALELRGLTCVGQCGRDTPLVAPQQLAALLRSLPRWSLDEGERSISRAFTALNFTAALAFFNAVGRVAEAETHHPDLHLTNYRDVRVVLSTHVVGGLTFLDFILAAKLDALPVTYSPKWLREHPQAE